MKPAHIVLNLAAMAAGFLALWCFPGHMESPAPARENPDKSEAITILSAAPGFMAGSLEEAIAEPDLQNTAVTSCLLEFRALPQAQQTSFTNRDPFPNQPLRRLLQTACKIQNAVGESHGPTREDLWLAAARSPAEALSMLKRMVDSGGDQKVTAGRFVRSLRKHPEVADVVLLGPEIVVEAVGDITWISEYAGFFGNDPEKLQQFMDGLSGLLHQAVALDAGVLRNLKHYLQAPDFLLGTFPKLNDRLTILRRWKEEEPRSSGAQTELVNKYFENEEERRAVDDVLRMREEPRQ